MFQLIESIRLSDGVFYNLPYHQARMDESVLDLFHQKNNLDLGHFLETLQYPKEGLFKCRIVYNTTLCQAEFVPYVPKSVNRLKIVVADDLTYGYKYADRTALNELFTLRDNCDDIIIVKNGLVTDSSYSNLVFFDGSHWITPAKPLLKGTMRQQLLDIGKIKAGRIRADDLKDFQRCRLINAMVEFEGPELSVSNLIF